MKLVKSMVSAILAVIMCVMCVGMFSACGKQSTEKAQFKTVPVLEDTRSTETKMNTFKTLNGNEVTYNMNTRKIVAISGAGDLVAFGLRPSAVIADSSTVESYKTFFEGVKLLNYTLKEGTIYLRCPRTKI